MDRVLIEHCGADVGTGTGIWAIEIGMLSPAVEDMI